MGGPSRPCAQLFGQGVDAPLRRLRTALRALREESKLSAALGVLTTEREIALNNTNEKARAMRSVFWQAMGYSKDMGPLISLEREATWQTEVARLKHRVAEAIDARHYAAARAWLTTLQGLAPKAR